MNWEYLIIITLCLIAGSMLWSSYVSIKKWIDEIDTRKAFNKKIDKLTAQLKESYELQDKWKNEEYARFMANKQPYIDLVEEYKRKRAKWCDEVTLLMQEIKNNEFSVNKNNRMKIEELTAHDYNTPP
jgi:hypothetical protein